MSISIATRAGARRIFCGAWLNNGAFNVTNNATYYPITFAQGLPDKFLLRNANNQDINVPEWAGRYRVNSLITINPSGTIGATESIVIRLGVGTVGGSYTGACPVLYLPYYLMPNPAVPSSTTFLFSTPWRTIAPATTPNVRMEIYSTLNAGVGSTNLLNQNDQTTWTIEFMENSTDG